MSTTLTETSLARYLPRLWAYSTQLCANESQARGLVSETLDIALKKQWKRPADVRTEAWLNTLMYQAFSARPEQYSYDATICEWRPTATRPDLRRQSVGAY